MLDWAGATLVRSRWRPEHLLLYAYICVVGTDSNSPGCLSPAEMTQCPVRGGVHNAFGFDLGQVTCEVRIKP